MSLSVAERPPEWGLKPFITILSVDISQETAAFLERTTMKKLNKVALLLASLALAAPMALRAQTAAPGVTYQGVPAQPKAAPTPEELRYANGTDQWQSANGLPWMNGTNELCWRDSNWTPATAYPGCDGAAIPPPPPPPAPAPRAVAPPPAPAPAPAPAAAPKPAAQKVTYAADTFFDFDKSVIKPEGKAKLDDLVAKTKGIALEVIIAVGHTDSIGTPEYNQGLSERRANAVKEYLVSKGIEKNRVYTEGKGEKSPIASNSTAEGRAKNRRTEIEVVGTRAAP
jgi:OOP family OmpA-OmpF porin